MKELLQKLVNKENLTREEAARAMDIMLGGEAGDAMTAAYLTALRVKGETEEEIIGSVEAMKAKGGSVSLSDEDYIDFVGTGGDGTNTFNISATSMIVCGGAGVVVAKHGNRAATSKSGSADVLEALGVEIALEPSQVEKCIEKVGVGFMMAQKFHGAMKNVAGVRRELGIRTIFNVLGPLSNPSNATRQVIGVFSEDMCRTFARVMRKMGVKRAMVVHGRDGMDEITTAAKTLVNEIKDGEIIEYDLDPKDYGISYADPAYLKGGTPQDNAKIAMDIFNGKKGPKRDIIILNSAAGIYIAGKAKDMSEGVEIARNVIDLGKAKAKLEELIEATKELAAEAEI